MLMMYAQWIWPEGVGVLLMTLGIGSFTVSRIRVGRRDVVSSSLQSEPPMDPVWQPSIVTSPMNSTASITVQANLARPVGYSVERLNGGSRLRVLTVVYEQSLGDLESAILRSDVFAPATTPRPPFHSVDDPNWTDRFLTKDPS